MRDYCRVFHTSMDYLAKMPMVRLMDELEDASEELAEEQARRQKQLEKMRARAPRVSHKRRR